MVLVCAHSLTQPELEPRVSSHCCSFGGTCTNLFEESLRIIISQKVDDDLMCFYSPVPRSQVLHSLQNLVQEHSAYKHIDLLTSLVLRSNVSARAHHCYSKLWLLLLVSCLPCNASYLHDKARGIDAKGSLPNATSLSFLKESFRIISWQKSMMI